jgi:outer membrane protein OmpA-like peptidoglycan-associated protein
MRSVLIAGAVLALVSSPLLAQSPDSAGHWELGLYPTARKLTYDLAARHEWGGGGTVGIGYRFSRVVSLNAELVGAWIPQLNTVSQGQVNELLPTLALQLQIPGNRFRPYVVLGGGHESFHFEAPLVPGTRNLKFWTGHTGVGFRLKLANWAALRTEANAQVSSHRPSWGAFSGVSFYPGARKSAPMVVPAPPVVQHDTVTVRERVTDTVVKTLVKVDTMRVNTRLQVTTSDTVTRTVKGQDVILVLRDANFDLGKSVLRPRARATLDSLALQLNAAAARSLGITITGYTDSIGSDAYNLKLGMARANSVKSYLASKGVDASRMTADSKGEADPIAPNSTPEGRQQNRRVVIGKQEQ